MLLLVFLSSRIANMEKAGTDFYNLFELNVLEFDVLQNRLSNELKDRFKGRNANDPWVAHAWICAELH